MLDLAGRSTAPSAPARGTAAARALLVTVGGLVLAGLVTLVFWRLAQASWAAATGPAVVDPADVLLTACAVIGALLAAWLGLGTAAAALAELPGALGAVGRAVARRIAPRAVRRGVAFLLGTSLLATFAPGTAAAAPAPARTLTAATRVVGDGSDSAPDPAFRPTTEVASTTDSGYPTAPDQAPDAVPEPSPDPTPALTATPTPTATPTQTADPTPSAGPSRIPSVDASTPLPGPRPESSLTPAFRPPAPPPPARTPAPLGPLGPAPAAIDRAEVTDHVVRRGDTLWDIARRALGPGTTAGQIAAEWPRWYAANRDLIGPDPNHIEPGQRLIAPASARTGAAR
ncbi:MAG TPA: LysM domain-containing protein [Dermatophilaceae bacterium]|nr:LysM domain-containing protein [Dermatophilaceae bacterium]